MELKNDFHKDLYSDVLEMIGRSYVPTDLDNLEDPE